MKALPLKATASGLCQCEAHEATHVQLQVPGPLPTRIVPVILKGTRAGTGCWSWNGDTEKPTLKPSLRSWAGEHKCHSWINDGQAIFLKDCSHEFAGQTMDLEDVE